MSLKKSPKEIVSSQGGRIDQGFWVAWGNMANGQSFSDAVKNSVMVSGLEPASKQVLIEKLKMALSKGRKPSIEDLPAAYSPVKQPQKIAMVQREWGDAVNLAKLFCQKNIDENRPLSTEKLKVWLIEKGFDMDLAEKAAVTTMEYFRSKNQYEQTESQSKEIKLKKEASEEYEYSCTMAYLPKDLAEKVFKLALEISDSALYDPKNEGHRYGRENEPHITVKFGTHTDDPEEVKNALEGMSPAKATLGRVSKFDDNDEYDVIKIDVVSDDLAEANKRISKKCKCTDSYPNYTPHVTVAYVEKGSVDHLIGKKDLDGVEILFDEFVFEDRIGNRTKIKLADDNKKAEKSAGVHPLDEKAKKEWFGVKIDAGNYHQQVRSELSQIIEEIWKVSEKNFRMMDAVRKTADRVCRLDKAGEIIFDSKEDEERPRLCAEKIYCILKSEISQGISK